MDLFFFLMKNVFVVVLKFIKFFKMFCVYCFKVFLKDLVMKNIGLLNI